MPLFENSKLKPPKTGYHVTYLSNLPNIMKNGLLLPGGSKRKRNFGENLIYFFIDPKRVKHTAEDIGLDRNKNWVLLKVSNFDPNYIMADEDYGDTWQDSVKLGGTFAYAKSVPSKNISVIAKAVGDKKYRHDEFEEFISRQNGIIEQVSPEFSQDLFAYLSQVPNEKKATTKRKKENNIGSADVVDGPYIELSNKQPFDLSKKDLKKLINKHVNEIFNQINLFETTQKTKILYHIGQRPGKPHKKLSKRYDPENKAWHRPWLKQGVENAIFLTDNWVPVWLQHGIWGNVYAYKIPIKAIKEAGGLHRYDQAKEVIISKDIWDKYNLQNTFIGKVADEKEVWEIIKKTKGWTKTLGIEPYEREERVSDKEKITDFESLLRFSTKPSKQVEILKLMSPISKEQMLQQIEKWLEATKQQADEISYHNKISKVKNLRRLLKNEL